MILRRIADAVRRQDWFVVFIELMIVVVGIYIGLQVDDWNKVRQEKNVEVRYLERLKTDTEFNILVMADLAGEHSTVAKTLFAFIEAAQEGTEDFPVGDEVSVAFCRFFINRQAGLRMATIEELISTGNLALIRDQELRESLQLIHAQTARASRDDSRLSDWVSETARSLRPYINWYSEGLRTQTGLDIDLSVDCTIDMNAMAGNQSIVSEIVKIYRTESILASIYTEQMNSWEDLQGKIRTAIPGGQE